MLHSFISNFLLAQTAGSCKRLDWRRSVLYALLLLRPANEFGYNIFISIVASELTINAYVFEEEHKNLQ